MMDKFVKIKADIDKDTKKKIKKILGKYKNAQNQTLNDVNAVIVRYLDDNGNIVYSQKLLEELRDSIVNGVQGLSDEETKIVSDFLKSSYETAYVNTASAISAMGIKKDFNIKRKEFIDAAVNAPVDGLRFSERIWNNTNKLANRIHNDVVNCVQTGQRPNEIARQIKKDFGSTSYQASRLVNTELARVVNTAQMDVYKESGVVEKVRWDATLESNTCDDCIDLDGKLFDLDNAPPLQHPGCRCCLIPIVDGYTPSQRADNEDKERYIDYMTYSEWEGAKND